MGTYIRPLSILVSIKTLAEPGGGAERVLATLVAGLCDRGHQVTLLTFDQPKTRSFYDVDPRAERADLGDQELAGQATISVLLRRVRKIRAFVVGRRFDVAIGCMHSMYVPLSFALKGQRTPLLANEHNVREYYTNRKLEFGLLRLAVSLSDSFSVTSSAVGRGFPADLHRKMIVLPNPVRALGAAIQRTKQAHVEVQAEEDEQTHASTTAKVLLSVGRLVALKDHKTLILAFARLSMAFPDWNLRIVGDGEMREELETLISALGLAERVELPGFAPNMGEEYASADIFVHPSKYESFGMATAEASAHGLPCVGFADCPGTNELIIDGATGKLVAGTDRVESLYQGLSGLMSEPELRAEYGKAARIRIEEFSEERCLDRLEAQLYKMCRV